MTRKLATAACIAAALALASGAGVLAQGPNPCAARNPCAATPGNPCAAQNPCAPKQPSAPQPCAAAPATGVQDTAAQAAFRQYKRWTKVNAAPVKSEPHGNTLVFTYVNKVAEGPALAGKFPFPAGAVLVKETFDACGVEREGIAQEAGEPLPEGRRGAPGGDEPRAQRLEGTQRLHHVEGDGDGTGVAPPDVRAVGEGERPPTSPGGGVAAAGARTCKLRDGS